MALNRTDASPIAYTRGSKEILDPTNATQGSSQATQSEQGATQDTTASTGSTLQPLKSDLYLTDELDDIERSIGSLTRFVPQVADVEPSELYKGLIRYCKSPWDPIGTGYEGLVTYDGSTWTRLGLDYDSDISNLQSQITSNDGDISALQSGKADSSHTHAYTDINGIDTGRLLGRTTASSGAAELITLGTNLSFTGSTLNAAGGSNTVAIFKPTDASFPASAYATLDTRNTHPVLDFDTTPQEAVYFHGFIPDNYDSEGLTVTFLFTSDATSGTIGFDVAFENLMSFDIDGDGFGTTVIGTPVSVSATPGTTVTQTITLSDAQIDGLGATDVFRMRVRRDTPNDTATSDAEVLMVIVRIQ